MGGVIKVFVDTDGIAKITGINPRDRKEEFEADSLGNLKNKKGEKAGKIKFIKSRGVIQIKTNFIQEIKIINKKQIGK